MVLDVIGFVEDDLLVEPKAIVGKNIRDNRCRLKLTQEALAERCDRVVILRLDPHDPGRLRSAKPDREHRPKRDRNLAEDIAGTSLADDAVDSINDLYRLNSAVKQSEQRPFFALVGGVFARHQTDVGCHARKPLARRPVEVGEKPNATNIVSAQHESNTTNRTTTRVLRPATTVYPRHRASLAITGVRRPVS